MTSKKQYNKQTHALNAIAKIVNQTEGLEWEIKHCTHKNNIPEDVELLHGTCESLEISVYREGNDLYGIPNESPIA